VLIECVDAGSWASMSAPAKTALVSCYEEDLRHAADAAGTSIGEAQSAFISWLDEEMSRGHTTYYLGRANGELVTMLRIHDDQVPDELLIEALQTISTAQRQGFASQLVMEVVRIRPGRYCADVHETNEASQATFTGAGFTKTECPAPGHDRWRLDTTLR
jgi:GNAT superfamily N-acetyltransferase